MRHGVRAAPLALAVLAAGCLGGSAASTTAPPPACAATAPPAVALTITPSRPPGPTTAACLARTYRNVVGNPGWSTLPKRFMAANPAVHTWQTRVLQYGFTPCRTCPQPGLDVDVVRRDHPEWILKDAAGDEVHPVDHPDWVLFDFGNVEFQAAWDANVTEQLTKQGWTGIVLVDAGNTQQWSAKPIDPVTGRPMTDSDRARYLAQALTVVRAGMKINGFSLVADNGPATVVDPPQIASTDAVTLGAGFAFRTGRAWQTLFTYFEAAVDAHVGAWVDDDGDLDRRRRVYGLASYLLVSGPLSSYGIEPAVAADSLYRVDLGQPLAEAVQAGEVWTREFAAGSVAVNPSAGDQTVTLAFGGSLTVPAGGAVIAVDDHIYSTEP
jgi:hypothetical protein